MILKANTESLSKIVEIHKEVLRDTFASKVGKSFIYSLYHILLKNRPQSEVFIYGDTYRVQGFIGLTKDRLKLNKTVNSKISFGQKVRIATFVLLHPISICKLYSKLKLANFIAKNYKAGFPSILTLGVSHEFQGIGVGRRLIDRADKFFRRDGFLKYFVDTESSNKGAIKFYLKLGFRRIATIAGNVVLEKKI